MKINSKHDTGDSHLRVAFGNFPKLIFFALHLRYDKINFVFEYNSKFHIKTITLRKISLLIAIKT